LHAFDSKHNKTAEIQELGDGVQHQQCLDLHPRRGIVDSEDSGHTFNAEILVVFKKGRFNCKGTIFQPFE